MRTSLATAAAVALLAAAPAGALAKTVTVGAKASGHTVHVERGDTLVVRLAENPSTGYAWRLSRRPDRDVLRSRGTRFLAGPDTKDGRQLVGVPGIRLFRWHAARAGTARIAVQLFPPGRGTRAARTLRYAVAVRR